MRAQLRVSSAAPKIRHRSVSYRGLRTYRYGPSTTSRCGTSFSSATAPDGNKAPANSSLAHPIFATAHVPTTTEPMSTTPPSTSSGNAPFQFHLSHQGESTNNTSVVVPQSPPTSIPILSILKRPTSSAQKVETGCFERFVLVKDQILVRCVW